MSEIFEVIERRFASLNSVSVERAHITNEEWNKIKSALTHTNQPEGDGWVNCSEKFLTEVDELMREMGNALRLAAFSDDPLIKAEARAVITKYNNWKPAVHKCLATTEGVK